MNKTFQFYWKGINAEGKKQHGEMTAISSNMAKLHLEQQHITVLRLKKKLTLFATTKKISTSDITIFYRQLATLTKASIPLTQSLQLLTQNPEHPLLCRIIKTLKTELESGKSLSHALQQYPHYFDSLSCHLIYIAEETGTLELILTRITQHKENIATLKNTIKQATTYPLIIIVVAILVSLTMLIVVVPRFTELFSEVHATLPAFTLVIIHLSHFLTSYYWIAFFPAIVGYILYFSYYQYEFTKTVIDKLLLKMPLFGVLLQKFYLARFSRTLATIVFAGIPITDGLKMLINISNNNMIKIAINSLLLDITTGQHLYQAMQKSKIFPAIMTQLIRVGEESGSLETMLEKIADFYESDIDYWAKHFSNILEPLIIMILGVLIGGLVIAMYLPIFKLGTVM